MYVILGKSIILFLNVFRVLTFILPSFCLYLLPHLIKKPSIFSSLPLNHSYAVIYSDSMLNIHIWGFETRRLRWERNCDLLFECGLRHSIISFLVLSIYLTILFFKNWIVFHRVYLPHFNYSVVGWFCRLDFLAFMHRQIWIEQQWTLQASLE